MDLLHHTPSGLSLPSYRPVFLILQASNTEMYIDQSNSFKQDLNYRMIHLINLNGK